MLLVKKVKYGKKEFGDHERWKFTSTYNADKVEYDSKLSSPKWGMERKYCIWKITSIKV